MRPIGNEDRAVRVLLVLLTVGALVPIWAAPIPPLQDLPNHLLKVDIFRRWLREEPGVRQIYSLNLQPLANYSCYVLLMLLTPFVDRITGARILLSIIVAALPWSARFFLRRVNPANDLFALAVPALNFSLFLMMGNLNFCLALSLYLVALAVFVSERGSGADWGFALLATGLYFTHGFVFLILLAVVAGLLAVDFNRARLRRLGGMAPGLLCLAVNITHTLRSGREAAGALRPSVEAPGLDAIRVALVWLLNPHGWGFDTYLALAWLVAIALCALVAAVGPVRRVRAGDPWRDVLRDNVWLAFAAVLTAGCFLAPAQLRDWFHLRARFSPLAALTLLGGLRMPRARAPRVALIAVFVLSAIAIEGRNTLEFVRRGAQVQEYVGGFDAMDAGASVIPFENLEEGPKYRDNLYSWAYYGIARGGWGPYLHVQPSYNPVIYRVTPWAPGEGRPPGRESDLRRIAACYDYVLFWNPKPGEAAPIEPFFEIVRSTPHLVVWRNRSGVRRSTPASSAACRLEKGRG